MPVHGAPPSRVPKPVRRCGRDACDACDPRVASLARRVLPLALLLAACTADGTRSAPSLSTTVTDSAGVRVVTVNGLPADLPVWRLDTAPRHTIDGTVTDDSTSLSRVGPVRWLASGGLVMHDPEASRLLVFDADGRFVRGHGRKGAGPGELRWLTSLEVQRGDTITTFDRELRRLSFWHPEAGYVRQVLVNESDDDELFTYDGWAFEDTLVVVLQYRILPRPTPPAGRAMVQWPSAMRLVLRDARGRTLGTGPEFAGSPSALDATGDSPLSFANLPFVAVGPSAVHFGSGVHFEVHRLSSAFTLAASLRWPAATEPLADDEVQRVREAVAGVMAAYVPIERARERLAPLFAPDMLPAQRPALRRALVDDAERVWVERFEPRVPGTPRQPIASRWTVLASDGTPLAALELPPLTRLEDVRGDRAVVVHRGADDLESVAVYRIQRTDARTAGTR